jgi:transposase InsO family protein
MKLTYSTNPHLPELRAKAVDMVRSGKSIRETARYFGFNPSTVSRWNRKAPLGGVWEIPTQSSRPKSHPKELSKETVDRIVALRLKLKGRCAEVIAKHLEKEGINVSLSSVKRTLDRRSLTKKKSPWKKLHFQTPRPTPVKPGDLVQIDTVHVMQTLKKRIYIYTMLDVYSRWSFAWASEKLSAQNSIMFVTKAASKAPFKFQCIQSDHGSEFSKLFTKRIKTVHRHSRIRTPNDNAHVERFNRTIQDEYLNHLPVDVPKINKGLPRYLRYYNKERLHLGINFKTPLEMAT